LRGRRGFPAMRARTGSQRASVDRAARQRIPGNKGETEWRRLAPAAGRARYFFGAVGYFSNSAAMAFSIVASCAA